MWIGMPARKPKALGLADGACTVKPNSGLTLRRQYIDPSRSVMELLLAMATTLGMKPVSKSMDRRQAPSLEIATGDVGLLSRLDHRLI